MRRAENWTPVRARCQSRSIFAEHPSVYKKFQGKSEEFATTNRTTATIPSVEASFHERQSVTITPTALARDPRLLQSVKIPSVAKQGKEKFQVYIQSDPKSVGKKFWEDIERKIQRLKPTLSAEYHSGVLTREELEHSRWAVT